MEAKKIVEQLKELIHMEEMFVDNETMSTAIHSQIEALCLKLMKKPCSGKYSCSHYDCREYS